MALGEGARVAGGEVDPVDLGQPLARGGLDVIARPPCVARLAEGLLSGLLRCPNCPRVRRRGVGFCLVGMLVVGMLARAQRLERRAGALPGACRDLAALIGDAAWFVTCSGNRIRSISRGWLRWAGLAAAAARAFRARQRGHAAPQPRLGLDRLALDGPMVSADAVSTEPVLTDDSIPDGISTPALALAFALRAVIIGSGSCEIEIPTESRSPPAGRPAGPAGTSVPLPLPLPRSAAAARSGRSARSSSGRSRSTQRLSPGPPRAAPAVGAAASTSARVAARRRAIEFGVTVTRTSRFEGGRARRTSMSAAPAATPSNSPNVRKANSLPVTVDVLLGRR